MLNLSKLFGLRFKTKLFFSFLSFLMFLVSNIYAQMDKSASALTPLVVNGDKVEFSTEKKEIIATGNVEINYKDTKLTCDRIIVNSQTKEGVAEGNARLEDKRGIIVGSKIIYNFAAKTGTIIDSGFRSNPYFGKAEETEKVSDDEFVNRRGYLTTCSLDNPHYRIKSRKMTIFPGDKIQTKDDIFYVGKAPMLYLPQLNRSLRDPIMHVQIMPGKSKDWGPYMLSAWRYNLTDDVSGRIYLDWRGKLGVAQGFGLNYTTTDFGKGDFKYYYTRERNHTKDFPPEDVTLTRKFQRYLVRWRHKWDIDEQTNLISEYYKIVDSKRALYPNASYNFLKEYFFREYEVDSKPLSYVSVHRGFGYSSLDFMMEKRTNRWYDEVEKLPEIKYSFPSYPLGETRLYFSHDSQAANLNHKHPAPSPSSDDVHFIRFDTNNELSLPLKVAFVNFNPFVRHRLTFYDQDVYGSATVLRTIFYSGTDASTNFYRIFKVKSNFLNLDINNLRHIVRPSIAYAYNNKPTIPSSKLAQIDSVDSISGKGNSAALELSNILQTKRGSQSVDIANFLVSNGYTFKTSGSRGSSFGDFLAKLELMPYSWMNTIINATYDRRKEYFSTVNYDLNFNLGKERSFGFGQRYQRKGPNEFTYDLKWRLTPKWKFLIYQRFITGHHDISFKRGLREQEYVLLRDLHCWTAELTYNVTRDRGESIWLIFRLKAFPELNFEYNREYHKPKPGELSY